MPAVTPEWVPGTLTMQGRREDRASYVASVDLI